MQQPAVRPVIPPSATFADGSLARIALRAAANIWPYRVMARVLLVSGAGCQKYLSFGSFQIS
jgi:hypothetical protein